MNQQRRRPRAIAIARAEKSRGQNELTAYLATLALFAVTAVALFSWLLRRRFRRATSMRRSTGISPPTGQIPLMEFLIV
ncbi:hypothetical protein [Sinorhizobium meliloti]|uniref:hypothetical protein n=1 Tax=Rhizobium meliloti TaxID=382 RepID=UPI0013E3A0AE|nr:hypothetical protein [Sinorhizobium meliloti]